MAGALFDRLLAAGSDEHVSQPRVVGRRRADSDAVRNRSLQEFLAALWMRPYCTDDDSAELSGWRYRVDEPLSEEYYWVWRFATRRCRRRGGVRTPGCAPWSQCDLWPGMKRMGVQETCPGEQCVPDRQSGDKNVPRVFVYRSTANLSVARMFLSHHRPRVGGSLTGQLRRISIAIPLHTTDPASVAR